MAASHTLRALRAAPATVLCLPVVGLLIWWAGDQGGYPVSSWAPGGVGVIALLGVALVLVPNRWADVPRPVLLAACLLTAFTVFSYLTVLWADDAGAAWEGANRTLLYLGLFCLFALWPQRPDTGLMLLGLWTLALVAIAAGVLLALGGAGDVRRAFTGIRLQEPSGYANAAAATFLMAFWPAVTLAASRRVGWLVRALCAAGAVVLWDVSLLSLSRGALVAFPVTVVVLLVLVPGRVRHLCVLLVVGAAAGAAGPAILHVGDALDAGRGIGDAVGAAIRATLLGAAAVGVAVGAVAAYASARPPSQRTARRLHVAGVGLAVACGLAVLGGGLAVAGNPIDRVRSGWDSFKGGYAENTGGGSRLTAGLGSNRYDFYRVALGAFRDAPVGGIGVDNFQQTYLREGHSDETPRYPHSVELRALAQTGLIGTALLLGALLAAGWAAMRAVRERHGLRSAVAGGAGLAAVYWLVHGSADWFFEWAGLGGAAFALLGLACALAPRGGEGAVREAVREEQDAEGAARPLALPGRAATAGIVAVGVVLAVPLVTAWTADHEISAAARVFAARPFEAYRRLDRARALDAFSARPDAIRGSIAIRFDDLASADRSFAAALARSPHDQYAILERGAIASARGERARAVALLSLATRLAPRDRLARAALQIARDGGSVDVAELNRRILTGAIRLGSSGG